MKKTMVIIKSATGALLPIENFLRNRGWDIISTSDLKDATSSISQFRPDFVLISIDHPNQKILYFPEIISKNFPVITMVFAEKATAASYQALQIPKADFILNPPITGPAIERAVSKYIKSEEKKKGGQAKSSKPPQYSSTPVKNNSFKIQQEESEKSFAIENITKTLSALDQTDSQKIKFELKSSDTKQNSTAGGWIPDADNKTFKLADQKTESTLENEIQTVLSGIGDSSKIQESLDQVAKVSCMMIQSFRFTGYLLIATAKERDVDTKLIEKIKPSLVEFLKKNGEKLTDTDAFQVKIKKVKFEPWAKEYAQFLKKSVYQGEELAMAFFPYEEVKAKLFDSFNHEMVAIHINDIETEKPVSFDLYVYLPVNKKYILYTPKGGVFYESQKNRLIKQGIDNLHLKSNEVEGFNRSRAETYLNQTIDQFHLKNRKSAA